MRLEHFETLRPVCPVCRTSPEAGVALRLAQVVREERGHIIEGALNCTNLLCLREFPILDGIPLLVTNIRQYIADNILPIYARRDLSDFTESVLGDCCGTGSYFDVGRQHLSSYAWDHYGDLDPQLSSEEPRPGSMNKALKLGLDLAGPRLAGPVLDAGCSVGRSTFTLAEGGQNLVLGVDLNFGMLRMAAEILRQGIVRYPLRRTGLVYQRHEFPVALPNREKVDFWACDAAALPFTPATFSLATNMNLLDCVYAPREMLAAMGRVLRFEGQLILTCPYDWSTTATPVEAWLGGHSQRSPQAGASEAVLRSLLQPNAHPNSIQILKLVAERENLTWHVRLHDRSTMTYKLHLVVAERCKTI